MKLYIYTHGFPKEAPKKAGKLSVARLNTFTVIGSTAGVLTLDYVDSKGCYVVPLVTKP